MFVDSSAGQADDISMKTNGHQRGGSTMKQSNLLFVFSDQHRWCDMGIYGNSQVQTPNFDRFAMQGVVFDHCISPSPL